jgi:LysM repeat protein
MEPEPGRGRVVARALAVVALAAAAVTIIVVVFSSIDGKDGGGGKRKKDDAQVSGCRPEAADAVEAGFYIVQEDDLMSLIAQRTCVPDEELARLNPEVDPQALSPGQCVSLVERGCEQRE